jgi:uncharacterized protein (DUF2267 family)
MATRGLEGIDETVQKTHIWINDVAEELDIPDKHLAFQVLRASLHALRDHLNVDESAQFAAQLPALVRGFYFEGWDPSKTPLKERNIEAFLERIADEAMLDAVPDPARSVRAVIRVIQKHVSQGEVEDVLGMIPGPVRELLTRPEH